MARIHVTTTDASSGNTVLVFHFPVPATPNLGGLSYRDALKASGRATTILPAGNGQGGTLTNTEATNIANGIVYEHVVQFQPDPFAADGLAAQVDALYAQTEAEVLGRLQPELRYYGLTRG